MPAIHDYRITDMTLAVAKALNIPDQSPALGLIREALESCWIDTAAICWSADAVKAVCPALPDDQVRHVLSALKDVHDPALGITEDTIAGLIDGLPLDYESFEANPSDRANYE